MGRRRGKLDLAGTSLRVRFAMHLRELLHDRNLNTREFYLMLASAGLTKSHSLVVTWLAGTRMPSVPDAEIVSEVLLGPDVDYRMVYPASDWTPRHEIHAIAARRGRPGILPKVRFEILSRDGFTCQYCGRKAPDVALEVDHMVPVSLGGKNDDTNLVTTCFECNRGKAGRMVHVSESNN